MFNNVTNILREVNLMLCIVVLISLLIRRIKNSKLYENQLRNDIWFMAFFWTLAAISATIEVLFETGTATRLVFSIAALLVTTRILWRYDKNWKELGEESKT